MERSAGSAAAGAGSEAGDDTLVGGGTAGEWEGGAVGPSVGVGGR